MIVYHLYKLPKEPPPPPPPIEIQILQRSFRYFHRAANPLLLRVLLAEGVIVTRKMEENMDSNKLLILCLMVLQHTTTTDFK